MGSPAIFAPRRNYTKANSAPLSGDDGGEFIEASVVRNRAAGGMLTGVLIGAGLWGVILVLAGAIKL
jgi:hypothetical protein